MQNDQEYMEGLLPGYFEGTLSPADRARVEAWKNLNPDNEEIFRQSEKVWRSMHLLSEMERYNPQKALQQVNRKIRRSSTLQWWVVWQRVAALLVIPLLVSVVWLSLRENKPEEIAESAVWQTFSTPPGVKARFVLPDSTAVWLNSSSSVSFPSYFSGNVREIDAKGEVFFEVKSDPENPFIVMLGKIHVRVTGTRFNIVNYDRENRSEVVLQSGKIELCSGNTLQPQSLSLLTPGEQAVYNKNSQTINVKKVETEKYVSWINGKLIFKDDPMDEVVRKLNRWFNVEIEVADASIKEYVYTATFEDESIDQILELLSISAPIRYQVVQRQKQDNGMFTAKRIILRKRS